MAFSLEAATGYLAKANARGRLGHAYLITGPEGSGKRELARRIATMALRSEENPFTHPDVSVAEPESKSRRIIIDQIRQLERVLRMRASSGGSKVGILFDADRLQPQASNAFLKTLEEPPANSLLLLVTAHPELLLDTILSRCIEVPLRSAGRIPPGERELELLGALGRFFSGKSASVAGVFGLVQDTFALLAAIRAEIEEEFATDLKREETVYSKTTDGSWLDGRETHYKALSEARYVLCRSRLIETLIEWWADLLRARENYGTPTLTEVAELTAREAPRFESAQILERIGVLERLRDQLERNVQEQLAIEVAFLRAFLDPGSSSLPPR